MKKFYFILLSLISVGTFSQDKNADNKIFFLFQDTLQTLCKKKYTSKTDSEKQQYNHLLLQTFERALNTDNSFDFPFDSLKDDIGILLSPDKKFRIINWNLLYNDGTQEYFAFIQEKCDEIKKKGFLRKEHLETVKLYPLIDKSAEIKNPENYISDNKKWFGMLYYKIILKKTKTKTYYTLLALDGNDNISKKKIIDVLTFDNNGTPRFGADIFNLPKKNPKRVIFEYSSSCSMSLKYNSQKDSIIFDHLAPTEPQLEGQFQYYCADMSYDGFGFKHGKWNYGMDMNAINGKDKMDKLYNDPRNEKSNHGSDILINQEKKKKKN